MTTYEIYNAFKQEFDMVGIIQTKKYFEAAEKLKFVSPANDYKTMVVLGLAYPKRIIKSTTNKLYASFYTFGKDYHLVLKDRIKKVMNNIPIEYELGVDNHPYNERLAAELSGIGYFAKNQLIINPEFGSYFFLGIVFLNIDLEETKSSPIIENCGDCRICIEVCPTNALSDFGYNYNKCISYYNQTKKVLTDKEINTNYCLFGCDICQLVCPKNINIKSFIHPEFELTGKEGVDIVDLFSLSDKNFAEKYNGMSYLWKGKTILMRNALTILLRQKSTNYNTLISNSILKFEMPWYKETATKILKKLEVIKKESI
ncbi:MAG: QueG-associated DUF1730 domain-containing protein [Candidatus Izemoplasmatales bacterium]